MTMTARTKRFATAALLGLGVAAAAFQPALAKDARLPQQQVQVDTRTTGSIAQPGETCDPNSPNADIVCRVTRGEQDPHFPSAPSNPAFGF
jgi:hypothetical protein